MGFGCIEHQCRSSRINALLTFANFRKKTICKSNYIFRPFWAAFDQISSQQRFNIFTWANAPDLWWPMLENTHFGKRDTKWLLLRHTCFWDTHIFAKCEHLNRRLLSVGERVLLVGETLHLKLVTNLSNNFECLKCQNNSAIRKIESWLTFSFTFQCSALWYKTISTFLLQDMDFLKKMCSAHLNR